MIKRAPAYNMVGNCCNWFQSLSFLKYFFCICYCILFYFILFHVLAYIQTLRSTTPSDFKIYSPQQTFPLEYAPSHFYNGEFFTHLRIRHDSLLKRVVVVSMDRYKMHRTFFKKNVFIATLC